MSNVSTFRPRRQCKPLQPVNIEATLTTGLDSAAHDLLHGIAIIHIHSASEDSDVWYWATILHDTHSNQPVAVELCKFGTHERYTITLEDERCDCPDAIYRPGRPGGCKHVVALRQTLPGVATAGKAGAA